MTKNEDLNQYAAYVRAMALRHDGEIFQNSGVEHAKIVIRELLSSAKETVFVVAGSLNDRSYTSDLMDGIIEFLRPENVRVVLDKDHCNFDVDNCRKEEKVSKAVKKLLDFGADVRVSKVDLDSHFCVVDGRSFRYEMDTDESKAFFAFGDLDLSARLNNHFDDIWSVSEKILA